MPVTLAKLVTRHRPRPTAFPGVDPAGGGDPTGWRAHPSRTAGSLRPAGHLPWNDGRAYHWPTSARRAPEGSYAVGVRTLTLDPRSARPLPT
ncbi:hypothetical protein OG400_01515 [Micromonospora ureilytica]|uniref:hypothetical protein n=1 Tax=Micromonospora ureilytica TaxID=709868 RepID=UPI002E10A603|nr:hypothetical protein OG400_01515 [Micromonospora ureilytica]